MKVGILGGGQLAQMLAQAGKPLGMEFKFICPDESACAGQYAEQILKPYDDNSANEGLVEWADVITYEFENIPTEMVRKLEQTSTLYPPSGALATAGDRMAEKTMFNALGIGTAEFRAVDSLKDLQSAVEVIGRPSILKTRSDGYDGKGQVVIRESTDLAQAWNQLQGVPCILESMVAFDREVSIIASRKSDGDIVFFPLTENHHRDGILRLSLCLDAEPLQQKAERMVQQIAEHLDYVGTVALELFQKGDDLLANEIAPRVHNSGHWTQDGTNASQFENHLRAVCDQDLIEPTLLAPTAMVNLIGTLPEYFAIDQDNAGVNEPAKYPNSVLHIYGKSERVGRKIGHINITAKNATKEEFEKELKSLLLLVEETDLADLFC